MKIYIEVLIIMAILLIISIWYVWNLVSRKRLIKKYTHENDKSRKGGKVLATNRDGSIETAAPDFPDTAISSLGYEQLREEQLLSDGASENAGENSDSCRRSSKRIGIGKFLGRRRK